MELLIMLYVHLLNYVFLGMVYTNVEAELIIHAKNVEMCYEQGNFGHTTVTKMLQLMRI